MSVSQLEWDCRFMALADEAASWSKDPDEKVGAVAVSADRRQFSFGYNGLPRGHADDRATLGDKDLKNALTIHAERNAILNCPFPLKGTTLYVSKAPCRECMKDIIQSGVVRVVYPGVNPNSRWFNNQMEALQLARDCHGPKCEVFNG